jgi:putative FmdB family regulatory protein
MPLYEYECQSCHEHVEKIQKFSAPEITVCPKCGGHLERVLSAPAVQFKGSGWYVSDYGAGKKKPASKGSDSGGSGSGSSGSESKSSESSGSESKTESKAETKSESKAESKPSTASSDTK